MGPARLQRHDLDHATDALAGGLDAPEQTLPRGPDRAGRIESAAQLEGVVQRLAQTSDGAGQEGGALDASLGESIQEQRSNGKPVDESVRAHAEQTLGYDLSMARVHTGPEAEQLAQSVGAIAFTSGRDIFLGPGASETDANLMTHELTHTVQQGMSEEQPKEVGAADSGAEAQASVQATQSVSEVKPPPEEAQPKLEGDPAEVARYTDDKKIAHQYARVSDEGNVIVLGKDNYSQNLYATADKIDEANAALKSSGEKGSYLSLIRSGGNISWGGKTLSRIAPVFKAQGDPNNKDLAKENKGKDESDTMSLWADCGRSSRVVMGSHGDQAPHATYGMGDGKEHETGASYTPSEYSDTIYMDAMPPFLGNPANADYLTKGVHFNENPGDIIVPTSPDQARAQYQGLSPEGKKAFDAFAHINTAANPKVGGGYTLNTEYNMPGFKEQSKMTWNFHWAGCVMKDGTDNITLENYADGNGYESINTDWNFQMYGTVKKGQTFYEQHLASNTHGNRATAFEVEPEGS